MLTAASEPQDAVTERRLDAAGRAPLLQWMIFTGVSVFALVLLWRYGLIQQMLAADRTYISLAIVLFYGVTTLHCLWRMVALTHESAAARAAARLVGDGAAIAAPDAPRGLVPALLRDLARRAGRPGARRVDPTLPLRGLAVRLRGSNQFGAFASDTLMKLGLVGTIVGFIMMLAPVASIDAADRGALKSSMSLMSEGMAVAMYTTLVGLVGSILVRIQYYMLEEATAALFAVAVRLVERLVAALPERPADLPE